MLRSAISISSLLESVYCATCLYLSGKGKGPRNTAGVARDPEADVKETGYNWRQLERLAQDQNTWRPILPGARGGNSQRVLRLVCFYVFHYDIGLFRLRPLLRRVTGHNFTTTLCKHGLVILCRKSFKL